MMKTLKHYEQRLEKEWMVRPSKLKNRKLAIFLMLLDDFETIENLQKYELNYVYAKVEKLLECINLVENGIHVENIERQMNVKYDFIETIHTTLLPKLLAYKQENKRVALVKHQLRLTTGQDLYRELFQQRLNIVMMLRDGFNKYEIIDTVGSLYHSRSWNRILEDLKREGYDISEHHMLDQIVYGLCEGEPYIDLGFSLSLRTGIHTEFSRLTRDTPIHVDLRSLKQINTEVVEVTDSEIDTMHQLSVEALIDEMNASSGEQLMKYLRYIVLYRDGFETLIKEFEQEVV